MKRRRLSLTWIIIAIAITAQINLEVFKESTNGFDLALDVIVFSIILYLQRGTSVMRMSAVAAAVSPLSRMLVLWSANGDPAGSAAQALPDGVFFIVFGAVYLLVIKYIFNGEHDLGSFVFAAYFGDMTGNAAELILRYLIHQPVHITYEIAGLMAFAAQIRTVSAVAVLGLLEWYTASVLSEEQRREYSRLVSNAAVIQDEIHLMEKNMDEVESIMKKGYDLYHALDADNYPSEIVNDALELARITHELKGDYRNVITVLSGLYDSDILTHRLTIRELVELEVRNAEALTESRGYSIGITADVDTDAVAPEQYRLMSVIRNLLTNSIEALAGAGSTETACESGPAGGEIRLTARTERSQAGAEECVIDISDNGPGIPEGRRDRIFAEGYSTKFDSRTGYIQRGLGLPIVKRYVEEDLGGSIELVHDQQRGTHFRIRFPVKA